MRAEARSVTLDHRRSQASVHFDTPGLAEGVTPNAEPARRSKSLRKLASDLASLSFLVYFQAATKLQGMHVSSEEAAEYAIGNRMTELYGAESTPLPVKGLAGRLLKQWVAAKRREPVAPLADDIVPIQAEARGTAPPLRSFGSRYEERELMTPQRRDISTRTPSPVQTSKRRRKQ